MISSSDGFSVKNLKFLIDQDVLITSYRKYYPFQFFPSLWEKLADLFSTKELYLLVIAYRKLTDYGDELSTWVRNNVPSNKLLDPDSDITIINQCSQVFERLKNLSFKEEEIKRFLEEDVYLLSYVLAYRNEFRIVTFEKLTQGRRIKIPRVCEIFQLRVSPCLRENSYLDLKMCFSHEKISQWHCITLLEMFSFYGIKI